MIIAALYETFARLLPDMAGFWRQIATEERAHAEVIDTLSKKLPNGTVQVDRTKFTFAGIQSAVAFVSARISRYSAEGVDRSAALAMAIDSERGMLEREFFNIFRSKDPDILTDFEELAVHTKEHLRRLEAEKLKEPQQ